MTSGRELPLGTIVRLFFSLVWCESHNQWRRQGCEVQVRQLTTRQLTMQIIQGSGNVSAYGCILQNRVLDGANIMNLLSVFNYLSFSTDALCFTVILSLNVALYFMRVLL